MLLQVPDVLTPEQAAHARRLLEQADWVDGRVTAGHQSARAKHNEQLPETHPSAEEIGDLIQRLNHDLADHPSAVQLTSVYHNLLRRWAEM